MTEERIGVAGAEEDLLLTFLAQTKEGKYAVVDKRFLSNVRMEAHAVITNDLDYYCSTS